MRVVVVGMMLLLLLLLRLMRMVVVLVLVGVELLLLLLHVIHIPVNLFVHIVPLVTDHHGHWNGSHSPLHYHLPVAVARPCRCCRSPSSTATRQ